MKKSVLLFSTLCLLELGHAAKATGPDKREYSWHLYMMNIHWNACRFLGYLNEEAPSHDLLIKQTERDFARLFPVSYERSKATERAWVGVNDAGLQMAEKIRNNADPDTACKNGYFNLKAVFQVTRDRLGLE